MPDLRLRPNPSTPSSSTSTPRNRSVSPTPINTTTTSNNDSSTTKRRKPLKSLNHDKQPDGNSTSATSSYPIPRSPFGAWTGTPKTPIMPPFTRQVPLPVLMLLVLGVVLLMGFGALAVGDIWGWEWTRGLVGMKTQKPQQQQQQGRQVVPLPEMPSVNDQNGVESSRASQHQGQHMPFETFVPEFPPVALSVRDDMLFQDPGERGHEAWMRMLPLGNGLVKVKSPRRYGLPKSQRWRDRTGLEGGGDAEVYEVAVVRELECLLMIREIAGELMAGTHAGKRVEERERLDVERCLDHLRQAILCHGDTTLEKVGNHADAGRARHHGPDGSPKDEIPLPDLDASIGTTRQCRDWEKIKGWLEVHRADQDE